MKAAVGCIPCEGRVLASRAWLAVGSQPPALAPPAVLGVRPRAGVGPVEPVACRSADFAAPPAQ